MTRNFQIMLRNLKILPHNLKIMRRNLQIMCRNLIVPPHTVYGANERVRRFGACADTAARSFRTGRGDSSLRLPQGYNSSCVSRKIQSIQLRTVLDRLPTVAAFIGSADLLIMSHTMPLLGTLLLLTIYPNTVWKTGRSNIFFTKDKFFCL